MPTDSDIVADYTSPNTMPPDRLALHEGDARPLPRFWWAWALLGVGATFALLPLDGQVAAWARTIDIGGDIRREMEVIQQFGSFTSLLVAGVVIWAMDPRWRVRLLDAAAAVSTSTLVTHAAKMLIGRPRPKFDDPTYFCGPFGAYPVKPGVVASGWEIWRGISSDLASMPSSHTSAAMTLGVVLAWFYPRLRWLMVFFVVVTGVSRVLLRAHYPADVAAGATLGYLAALFALSGQWGSRAAGLSASSRVV